MINIPGLLGQSSAILFFSDMYCILHKLKVVYVTNPESWTAAAMYQATRIFVSNCNAKMVQR